MLRVAVHIVAVAVLSGASVASAATYYVDSGDGRDSNTGTSPGSAWQTLTKVENVALRPGDELLFKRGATWTGKLMVSASGTSAAPIRIDAYSSGALPRITGAACVSLHGDHVTAHNLHAHNCTYSGIYVGGDSVTVADSLATANVTGIQVGYSANRANVHHNTFSNNTRLLNGNGSFGILLNGTNANVHRNKLTGSGAAVEVYGGSGLNGGHDIHHNRAAGNNVFTELGKSAGNDFYYNLVTSGYREAKAIVTRGPNHTFGPVNNTRFYNNTVYYPGAESQGFVCGGSCRPSHLILRNNIFHTLWKAGYTDGAVDENYNLFSGARVFQFTLGNHSLTGNPMFVNASEGDLRLRADSPAVDAGTTTLAGSDYDGNAVPSGNAVDLGAFELAEQSAGDVSIPQPEEAPAVVRSRLEGTAGADYLRGGPGNDVIRSFGGPDSIFGRGGDDLLRGGRGRDRVHGGSGDDDLRGGPGGDRLHGGPGADILRGGPGDDRLFARDGTRDVVLCGTGHDVAFVDRHDRVGRSCEVVRRR